MRTDLDAASRMLLARKSTMTEAISKERNNTKQKNRAVHARLEKKCGDASPCPPRTAQRLVVRRNRPSKRLRSEASLRAKVRRH